MNWILNNWQEVVNAMAAVMIAARIVVKLTPTPADDTLLAKFVDVLKALGLHLK
jgi:hypothetical protein